MVWAAPPSRSLAASAAASTPRPPTWVLTWWARWRRTSPRTTHATPPSSPVRSGVGGRRGMDGFRACERVLVSREHADGHAGRRGTAPAMLLFVTVDALSLPACRFACLPPPFPARRQRRRQRGRHRRHGRRPVWLLCRVDLRRARRLLRCVLAEQGGRRWLGDPLPASRRRTDEAAKHEARRPGPEARLMMTTPPTLPPTPPPPSLAPPVQSPRWAPATRGSRCATPCSSLPPASLSAWAPPSSPQTSSPPAWSLRSSRPSRCSSSSPPSS